MDTILKAIHLNSFSFLNIIILIHFVWVFFLIYLVNMYRGDSEWQPKLLLSEIQRLKTCSGSRVSVMIIHYDNRLPSLNIVAIPKNGVLRNR